MNGNLRVRGLVFLASFAFVAAPAEALAYIDPGAGSMVLQLLLGGFAGALLVGKLYWHNFKALFTRKTEPSEPTEPPDRSL